MFEMNVPLQIIYKTSSVGRWTVEIHLDSHKSSAHEIKLSGYSIPGSHRLYRDRDFEDPYSKEQKHSNRRPGTERVPAFDPKIAKVLFLET